MEEKIKAAIENLATKVGEANGDLVSIYSSAVLNLTHALITLKGYNRE